LTVDWSLQELLQYLAPGTRIRTVLVLDPKGELPLKTNEELTVQRLAGPELPCQAYDLGVVIRVIEYLEPRAAAELLGRLRNQCCPRLMLICAQDENPLDDNALRALGFQLTSDRRGQNLFCYDVDTYNEKREWNDATHWAHPEHYGQRRW